MVTKGDRFGKSPLAIQRVGDGSSVGRKDKPHMQEA